MEKMGKIQEGFESFLPRDASGRDETSLHEDLEKELARLQQLNIQWNNAQFNLLVTRLEENFKRSGIDFYRKNKSYIDKMYSYGKQMADDKGFVYLLKKGAVFDDFVELNNNLFRPDGKGKYETSPEDNDAIRKDKKDFVSQKPSDLAAKLAKPKVSRLRAPKPGGADLFPAMVASIQYRLAMMSTRDHECALFGLLIPLYEIENLIDSPIVGGSGNVYFGRHDNRDVAVKIVKPDAVSVEMFQQEINVLLQLGYNRRTVRFYGYCDWPNTRLIVTKKEKTSLSNFLKSNNMGLPAHLHYAIQTTEAISFLHKNKIIHRDLKAANFLINALDNVRLCDFGSCIFMADAEKKMVRLQWPSSDPAQGVAGVSADFLSFATLTHLAPELLTANHLKSDCIFSEKTEVYAFALILWEIFTNEEVFKATPMDFGVFEKIIVQQNKRATLPQEEIVQILHNLMKSCWHKDPDMRPTFEQILSQLKFAALCVAALVGTIKEVKDVLWFGADVTGCTSSKMTPLHYACLSLDAESSGIVQELILALKEKQKEKGGGTVHGEEIEGISVQDKFSMTPLGYAIMMDYKSVVSVLLKGGANIEKELKAAEERKILHKTLRVLEKNGIKSDYVPSFPVSRLSDRIVYRETPDDDQLLSEASLMSFDFVSAKIEAGQVIELIHGYKQLKKGASDAKKFEEYYTFVRNNVRVFLEDPGFVWQAALNLPDTSIVFQEAETFIQKNHPNRFFVRLANKSTNPCSLTLECERAAMPIITCAAVSNDGTKVAMVQAFFADVVVSFKVYLLVLWDLETGLEIAKIPLSTQTNAFFSSDSKLLFCFNPKLHIYTTNNGALSSIIDCVKDLPTKPVKVLIEYIGAANSEEMIAFWHAPSSSLVTLDTSSESQKEFSRQYPIACLEFLNPSVLIEQYDNHFNLWNMQTDTCVTCVVAEGPESKFAKLSGNKEKTKNLSLFFLVVSPDRKYIATSHKHPNVVSYPTLWDASGAKLWSLKERQDMFEVFSPEGQILVLQAPKKNLPAKIVSYNILQEGEPTVVCERIRPDAQNMYWVLDNKLLLVIVRTIMVWDLAVQETRPQITVTNSPLYSMQDSDTGLAFDVFRFGKEREGKLHSFTGIFYTFSADYKYVCFKDLDFQSVHVAEVLSGKIRSARLDATAKVDRNAVNSVMQVSNNGEFLCYIATFGAFIHNFEAKGDVKTKKILDLPGSSTKVSHVSFSRDDTHLSFCTANWTVVYDIEQERVVLALQCRSEMSLVYANNSILVINANRALQWWDIKNGNLIHKMQATTSASHFRVENDDTLHIFSNSNLMYTLVLYPNWEDKTFSKIPTQTKKWGKETPIEELEDIIERNSAPPFSIFQALGNALVKNM